MPITDQKPTTQNLAPFPVRIVQEGKADRMGYLLYERAPFMSHFGFCCVCDSPIPPDLNPDDGLCCSTKCAKMCIAEVQ